jgi:hypothetical protein
MSQNEASGTPRSEEASRTPTSVKSSVLSPWGRRSAPFSGNLIFILNKTHTQSS